MRTCSSCGGAIFGFNEVVGYAGPICGCHRQSQYDEKGGQESWVMVGLYKKIAELEGELRRVEGQRNASNAMIVQLQDEVANRQAKIDELMMEYCPDEMTMGQLVDWSAHQKPVEVSEDPCGGVCPEGSVCRTPKCRRLVSGYGYGPKKEE